MIKLDETDLKILKELQKNGRITTKELSSHLKLSPTPTFERVKKLERSGIIDHYSAILDAGKLGKNLYAFAHISLKDHTKDKVQEFSTDVSQMEEVQECHYVTGDSDFILKILLSSMEDYREFMMERIFGLKNIAKVESFLSLSVLKNNNFIPLADQSLDHMV